MRQRTRAGTLLVLILTAALWLPLPSIAQPVAESEGLTVHLAGNSLFWQLNFAGANLTLPGLAAREVELTAPFYALIAVSAEAWRPEHELWSNHGVRLLEPTPLPRSGVLLVVNGTDAEAAGAARAFEDLLRLAFAPLRKGEGQATFYSPANFTLLVRNHLWRSVPLARGGLARLVSDTVFVGAEIPVFRFEGRRDTARYDHQLTLSATTRVNATDSLRLTSLFPSLRNLNASRLVSTSLIEVITHGMLVAETQGANHTNRLPQREGRVSVSVRPGHPLPPLNITVLRHLPNVLALREPLPADRTVLRSGELLEIRIILRHPGPVGATPAENVTVREAWWRDAFDLVRGDVNRTVPRLEPQQTIELPYQLRVRNETRGVITQGPADNRVTYRVRIGRAVETFETQFNQLPILLNQEGEAVWATASFAAGPSPDSTVLPLNVTIVNSGSRTAFRVAATVPGAPSTSPTTLLPGRRVTERIDLPIGQLIRSLQDIAPRVHWDATIPIRDTLGNTISTRAQVDPPNLPALELHQQARPLRKGGETLLNVTLSLRNAGTANATGTRIRIQVPTGWEIINSTLRSIGGRLEANISRLAPRENRTFGYLTAVPRENVLLPLAQVEYRARQLAFARLSNGAGAVLGLALERHIEPAATFVQLNATVRTELRNVGTRPVYDVSLADPATTFLQLVNGSRTASASKLAPGEALRLFYRARLVAAGEHIVPPPQATVFFAGQLHTVEANGSRIDIYDRVRARLTITPSVPIEGRTFRLELEITNPSPVSVGSLRVAVNLPATLELVEGTRELEFGQLAGKQTERRMLTLRGKLPANVVLPAPQVSFVFDGQSLVGVAEGLVVRVGDDVATRYLVPTGLAAVLALGVALWLRRVARPITSGASGYALH